MKNEKISTYDTQYLTMMHKKLSKRGTIPPRTNPYDASEAQTKNTLHQKPTNLN